MHCLNEYNIFATKPNSNLKMESHSVKDKKDVEQFLNQFLPKMKVFGIIFLDRDKNEEGLKMLGIVPSARKEIIKTLLLMITLKQY